MSSAHTMFQLIGISPEYNDVAASAAVAVVLTAVGIKVRMSLSKPEKYVLPAPKTTLMNVSVSLVEAFRDLLRSMMGHEADKFLGFVCSYFCFILIANLMGMVPGLVSTTGSVYTNFAMAAITFVVYHAFGLKEHGLGYFKQFTGGLPPKGYGFWITVLLTVVAGMVVVLELIGHLIRPVSLTARLWGNIMGDHKLVEAISSIAPLGLPILAMLLGILVCFVQAFVFSLLSAVYIKLAVSHDH